MTNIQMSFPGTKSKLNVRYPINFRLLEMDVKRETIEQLRAATMPI